MFKPFEKESSSICSKGSISISKANSLAKTSGSTAISTKLSLLGSLFFVILKTKNINL